MPDVRGEDPLAIVRTLASAEREMGGVRQCAGGLKWAVTRVLTPGKLANTTNQPLPPFLVEPSFKMLVASPEVWEGFERRLTWTPENPSDQQVLGG